MRQDLNEVKKVLEKYGYSISNIICEVMGKFNFKTLGWRAGVVRNYAFCYGKRTLTPEFQGDKY